MELGKALMLPLFCNIALAHPLGLYILLALAAVVALFAVVFFVTCMSERLYLSGDVEPVTEFLPYNPIPYWQETRDAAARSGLLHAGDFATRKDTSNVKGLLSLFISPDHRVLAAVYAGSAVGAKLKKTVLRTRLASGLVLESSDNPGIEDFSGGIDRAVLLNAGIEELMGFHILRIQQPGSTAMTFNPNAVLQEWEQIDLDKGRRWVQMGRARWVDRQETSIRMTFRGAYAQTKRLFQNTSKLSEQQHRSYIRRAGSRPL